EVRTAQTLGVLRAVVDRLAEAPGDRVLALVSDGFSLRTASGGSSLADLRGLVSRATRSGIVVYSVAAQGIDALEQAGADAIGAASAHPQFAGMISASRQDWEAAMRSLAERTGGAFLRTNDLGASLDRIARGTGAAYLVSYYPEATAESGPH